MFRIEKMKAMATMLSAASMCAFAHRTEAAPSVSAVAVNPFIVHPGEQPPFNPADYQPFIGRGNGRITADLTAQLKNGKRVATSQKFSAIVYPYTPFTAWLITRFASLADGANGFLAPEPGYEGVPAKVPDYLLGTVYGREQEDPTLRAARRADSCTSNGVCEFLNLKPGKYIVYGLSYEMTGTTTEQDNNTYSYNPADDRWEEHRHSTVHDHEVPLNGVVLLLHGHLNVKPGGHTYAAPPDVQPAAYFNLKGPG